MPSKAEFYRQMAEQVSTQLVGSWKEWTAFLTTAARLYKYPFHEQMMIYAQRPEATACAEYDLWNDKMGRYVRRGSKGIALVDDSGDKPRGGRPRGQRPSRHRAEPACPCHRGRISLKDRSLGGVHAEAKRKGHCRHQTDEGRCGGDRLDLHEVRGTDGHVPRGEDRSREPSHRKAGHEGIPARERLKYQIPRGQGGK